MFTEIKKLIQKDRKLQLILLGGLIIQVITCITAIGFYHPDQHFQIVEFSSWQSGKESGASYVWEFDHFVRPTLQIYLFSAYTTVCSFFNIHDPYLQLTILRILLGLKMFVVFNLISLYYFKNEKTKTLYSVLLILNFSWILPYTRTLFSSEIVSSLVFFGTLFLYDIKKNKNPGWWFLVLTGFLFGLSFYFRFQMGFALAGFGLWMLFVEKKYARFLPMAVGFLIALLINFYLDKRYYGEWVFTPYQYFFVNINEGRATSFGTSSFLRYIGLLVAVITAPPFSLILFYYGCKALLKKYTQPVCIAVFLFILCHCLVGHKEERFLFPVFNILPVIIGWSLADLFSYYERCKRWIANLIKATLIITIVLNTVVLILFTFIPYSQAIQFSYDLKNNLNDKSTTVYCLYRTPFETMSGGPMFFYRNGAKNLELKKISTIDSIRNITGTDILIATTYNDIKQRKSMFDSLGYKPVMYSSKLLWNINRYLDSKKRPTINDAWVLYKKE